MTAKRDEVEEEYEPLGEYNPTDPAAIGFVRKAELEVLNAPMRMSLEEMSSLESFTDVVNWAQQHDVKVLSSNDVFAGGFVHCEDKASLVNVPLIIVHWEFFYSQKNECDGVAVWCVTERPIDIPGGRATKVTFTDLSTGIREELRQRTKAVGGVDFIHCPKGLISNSYTVEVDGKEIEATTYRLN